MRCSIGHDQSLSDDSPHTNSNEPRQSQEQVDAEEPVKKELVDHKVAAEREDQDDNQQLDNYQWNEQG